MGSSNQGGKEFFGCLECMICYDAKEDTEWQVLPCGHVACKKCMQTSCKQQKCCFSCRAVTPWVKGWRPVKLFNVANKSKTGSAADGTQAECQLDLHQEMRLQRAEMKESRKLQHEAQAKVTDLEEQQQRLVARQQELKDKRNEAQMELAMEKSRLDESQKELRSERERFNLDRRQLEAMNKRAQQEQVDMQKELEHAQACVANFKRQLKLKENILKFGNRELKETELRQILGSEDMGGENLVALVQQWQQLASTAQTQLQELRTTQSREKEEALMAISQARREAGHHVVSLQDELRQVKAARNQLDNQVSQLQVQLLEAQADAQPVQGVERVRAHVTTNQGSARPTVSQPGVPQWAHVRAVSQQGSPAMHTGLLDFTAVDNSPVEVFEMEEEMDDLEELAAAAAEVRVPPAPGATSSLFGWPMAAQAEQQQQQSAGLEQRATTAAQSVRKRGSMTEPRNSEGGAPSEPPGKRSLLHSSFSGIPAAKAATMHGPDTGTASSFINAKAGSSSAKVSGSTGPPTFTSRDQPGQAQLQHSKPKGPARKAVGSGAVQMKMTAFMGASR